MRQAKDPYFKKGGARGRADAAEADAAAMPPPASRLPPKRKKGLGFQARLLWMAPGDYSPSPAPLAKSVRFLEILSVHS